MAFLAASRKSFTTEGISSVVSRLGDENSAVIASDRICGVNGLSVQEIGAWPFGWKPVANCNKKFLVGTIHGKLSKKG
ncbi:hypothetical protein SOVF_214720 [Spinacia oleracea]|nr:hypothetical protein SOVF_214720 [Spinacia oleracea]